VGVIRLVLGVAAVHRFHREDMASDPGAPVLCPAVGQTFPGEEAFPHYHPLFLGWDKHTHNSVGRYGQILLEQLRADVIKGIVNLSLTAHNSFRQSG
jgi:hypothetical protein